MIRTELNRTAHAPCVAHAAPAGGARLWWGRGCALVAVLIGSSAFAGEKPLLPVPSGQDVRLEEVLIDENPGESWLRLRLIATAIGAEQGGYGYDEAAQDMDHLCEILAVPYVAQHDLAPARIVISMSDRPVEFGRSDPEATQFFEAYSLQDGRCIWEEY
ncbi:DUF6497 family protein [Lutimaribacter marinistellae]|uniref:DUF6497 family protein n=1 Tax=Lutimaribacter marinistellae TaxID=1820329 RepID=A0ABV7TLW2_9RHOB